METVEVGFYDAGAHFNMGVAVTIEVLKQCGIEPWRFTEKTALTQIKVNSMPLNIEKSRLLNRLEKAKN